MKIDKRNISVSDQIYLVSGDAASYRNWDIANAVKEGYKISGWVHTAVNKIMTSASSVRLYVSDMEGEMQKEHPVSMLLNNPHPYLTRKQFYELLYAWLELGGNSYFKTVHGGITEGGGVYEELWPISPDKIVPVLSNDPSEFIEGYKIKNKSGVYVASQDYDRDNVMHIKYVNPANPSLGIGTLEAAARSVDLDNAQQDWNVQTMQNRGVVDGVFTFEEELDKTQADGIMQRIMEKFSGVLNARKPLVIGSKAKYQRLGLNAVEIDYLNSRKFNREEIFGIFGVPVQLGGSTDSMTYDNYSSSIRIFWEDKLIPSIKLVCDQMTGFFKAQGILDDNVYIVPDLSNVQALKANEKTVSEAAKIYWEMGVPVKSLNSRFELGIEEFVGWELPWSGRTSSHTDASSSATEEGSRSQENEDKQYRLIPMEKRNIDEENNARDGYATGEGFSVVYNMLAEQQSQVFDWLDKNGISEAVIDAVDFEADKWIKQQQDFARIVAEDFASRVVVNRSGKPVRFDFRAEEDDLITEYLDNESVIMKDVGMVSATTKAATLKQIKNAVENDYTVQELKQALQDTGIYNEERALRISRTVTGTASSIGQLAGGIAAGATQKTWVTSVYDVRDIHSAREGETVPIEERFSIRAGTVGPRYPLDPEIAAEDRVNCRCAMSFS